MTPTWIDIYLGLISQFYSLALLVLSVVALLSVRRETGAGISVHMCWLAAFGMLHGLKQLIDLERRFILEDWLLMLSTTLMIISFAVLLEFGRRVWNERPSGCRLVALPLYTAAGLGTVTLMLVATEASAGLELGARYLFGVPGAVLMGFGLFAQTQAMARAPDTVTIILWLRMASIAIFGYAALTLFLPTESGLLVLNWLPTEADFLAITGLPVQLPLALCTMFLALGFIIINNRIVNLTAKSLRRVTNRLDGFVYRCRNDQAWTLTFMSEGGETLTGYPTLDFLRGERHFAHQIHPDDQPHVWNEVQAALLARRYFRLQYRMIDRAGNVRWCYEEGCGVFDKQGELLYLEGMVRNDDARHQAETALTEQAEQTQAILDNMLDGIITIDMTGIILSFNTAATQIFGYTDDEVLGRNVSMLMPNPHREMHDGYLRNYQHTGVAKIIGIGREVEGQRKDGSLFPMELAITEVIQTGQPLYVGMVRDITERKQIENELHELNLSLEQRVKDRTAELGRQLLHNTAILGTAIDGFFAVDARGHIIQTNPAFCVMLGYEETELLGMSIPDIEAQESHDEVVAHIQKIIAKGHDRFDTRHRRKDGETVEVEISVSLVNIDDEPIFYVFTRDIGPRKAAETELRQALDQAEHANTAKNEFLSRMSHELRTPLNAILGFTQLLQLNNEQPLDKHLADNLSEIHNASEHLLVMVNNILDLTHLESGRLRLCLEQVLLCNVIEHCVGQIEQAANERGIQLRLLLNTSYSVMADANRLKQVLLNFLSNAVKFNRQGGSIEVECASVEGNRVRVNVRDTGLGLTNEQQECLFRPFERLESAYEGIDGVGIGLALAKLFVENMQGVIGVESVTGEGSCFWIELPLCEEKTDISLDTPTLSSTTKPAIYGKSHKILYIEDNDANLRLVQKILNKHADIELLTAKNAEQGLMMAALERPQLILLDINLPGMDGFEALVRLQANPITCGIPVIAVSANAMKSDIERASEVGFVDYITKPFQIKTLLSSVDHWLTKTNE